MQIDNPLQVNDWEMGKFLRLVLFVQAAFLIVACLNALGFETPVFTQVIAFVYLTFIPGIVILRALRLHDLSATETLLYSVGLSIAFLMFLGALINILHPYLVSEPISDVPLTVTVSATVFALCLLSYARDRDFSRPSFVNIKNAFSFSTFFLCLLPLLSVLGTYLMNFNNNNTLLLILLPILSIIPLVVTFDRIPRKLYPLAIFAVGISLLYHTSFITNNLSGFDIHAEYYFSSLVRMNSYWDSTLPNDLNAMLSITILAPIFSDIGKMSLIWVFKIIYPLLFSLVPLGLYRAFQKQTSDKIAFLSCFLFMSIWVFFSEMVQLARQEIASLFLVLLVLLIADVNLKPTKSRGVLLIVFGFSLIVAHYGLSYVFLFCLLSAWVALRIVKTATIQMLSAGFYRRFSKSQSHTTSTVTSSATARNVLTRLGFISLFTVSTLVWYLYVSGSSTLNAIVGIGNHIANSILTEFFNPAAAQGLSLLVTVPVSPLHEVNWILYLFFVFSIIIGFLAVVSKNRRMKFGNEYLAFSFASLVVAAACVGVPFFASALNTSRLFQITLFFLAPFCIVGGIALFNELAKALKVRNNGNVAENSLKVLSVFLVVFLLFNSGFVYEVTRDHPTSISLNSSVDGPRFSDAEVHAAVWMTNLSGNTAVWGDAYGHQLLLEFAFWKVQTFWGNTKEVSLDAYIYFRSQNVKGKVMWSEDTYPNNYTSIQDTPFFNNILDISNKIYDDGASQIYRPPIPR